MTDRVASADRVRQAIEDYLARRRANEPAPPDGIPIRVTEIDWFFECAWRWHKQKVTGEWPQTITRPFIRGRACHASREYALLAKAATGEWPDVAGMTEAATRTILEDMGGESAPWDPESEEHYFSEPETGEKVLLSDLQQEIEPYIAFDRSHVLPRYENAEAVMIEQRWYVPIEDPELREKYVLTGKIDLLAREPVSGRLALHDLKTGSKVSQEYADLSPQLSGYSAGVHALTGEWPLHAIGSPRFLKRPPREVGPGAVVEQIEAQGEKLWAVYETITTDRNEADVAAFLERLKMFLLMKESGWYPPAAGGFMSPCQRCPHAFARDPRFMCKFSSRASGKITTR